MYSLTISRAVDLVRKNLDEVGFNESGMLGMSKDSVNMETIIARTLPESINRIHSVAPVTLLDGKDVTLTTSDLSWKSNDNKVLDIKVDIPFLRLVAFRASDSDIVVGDVTDEYSPEGRMQADEYARGSYDDPVLVLMQGKGTDFDTNYHFRYYSFKNTATIDKSLVAEFVYIPRHKYEDSTTSFLVADRLVDAVINQLTADVLAIYGSTDKAQYFTNKITL